MLPVSQLLNEFFGDSTLVQQQPEDLLLEKLFEIVPVECRCARELIVTPKATIRNENMKMRVVVNAFIIPLLATLLISREKAVAGFPNIPHSASACRFV